MTTNLTLATKQFNQLNDLVNRKIETMEFELIPRQTPEDMVVGGWMELQPYTSVSTYDPATGNMKFAARQVVAGEGEEQKLISTTVGLTTIIGSIDDITCTRMDVREDGTKVYHMTMSDLLGTCLAACRRDLQEQFGLDPIEKFNIDVQNTVRFTFFNNSTEEAELQDKVRFGVSVPLTLPLAQMEELHGSKPEDKPAFNELVINAGHILLSFDVSEVASKVIDNMRREQQLSPWSVQVISQQLLQYFDMMRSHVSYGDVMAAVAKNVKAQQEHAMAQAQAHMQAMQQGQEAIAQAEVADAANAAGLEAPATLEGVGAEAPAAAPAVPAEAAAPATGEQPAETQAN